MGYKISRKRRRHTRRKRTLKRGGGFLKVLTIWLCIQVIKTLFHKRILYPTQMMMTMMMLDGHLWMTHRYATDVSLMMIYIK